MFFNVDQAQSFPSRILPKPDLYEYENYLSAFTAPEIRGFNVINIQAVEDIKYEQ